MRRAEQPKVMPCPGCGATAHRRDPRLGNHHEPGCRVQWQESTLVVPAGWEPSSWLRDAIASRCQFPDIKRATSPAIEWLIQGTPERGCDRCGVDVPLGEALWMFQVRGTDLVSLAVSLCDECRAIEFVSTRPSGVGPS